MNLLEVNSKTVRSLCRAVWTVPMAGEDGAPDRRIIHSRAVNASAPARFDRVGLREGLGALKGGFHPTDPDWPTAVRVLAWSGGSWDVVFEVRDHPRPAEGVTEWHDLGGLVSSAVVVELRRCGVDDWWSTWNIAMTGVVLEGEPGHQDLAPAQGWAPLEIGWCDLSALPTAVTAERLGSSVRYRTPFLDVGFQLTRPALSHLSVDSDGAARHSQSLLHFHNSRFFSCPPHLRTHLANGPRLAPIGGAEVAGVRSFDVVGRTEVRGSVVSYDLTLGSTGQRYQIEWEVREDRLVLRVTRHGRGWCSGMGQQRLAPAVRRPCHACVRARPHHEDRRDGAHGPTGGVARATLRLGRGRVADEHAPEV